MALPSPTWIVAVSDNGMHWSTVYEGKDEITAQHVFGLPTTKKYTYSIKYTPKKSAEVLPTHRTKPQRIVIDID